MSVTVDGVWIDDKIYWVLWYEYISYLYFTNHCNTQTSVLSLLKFSVC
jgi:hypothetical protein